MPSQPSPNPPPAPAEPRRDDPPADSPPASADQDVDIAGTEADEAAVGEALEDDRRRPGRPDTPAR
jgi:hypothetical protein